MIHVVATVDLNPGQREAFLAEFHKVLPAVLAEAGCVAYVPTIDFEPVMPGQTAMGPDRVVVVEQWETMEHLLAHGAAPHMRDYRRAVKPLVSGMELRFLQSA